MSEISRSDFNHWIEVPVRWGDVDRLGHVNNVQYFRYSEEARTSWVSDMGSGLSADVWSGGQGPILAEIQCLFISQLHHPAIVQIGTRVVRLGNSSMVLNQGFFIATSEQPLASSESRIVWFDYENQRSVRVPELLRERIRQNQTIPPEES